MNAAPSRGLREGARRLRDRLGEVRFDLLIRGDQVSVAPHEVDGRFDYAERVLATFERFRQGGRPAIGVRKKPQRSAWTPSRPASWISSSNCPGPVRRPGRVLRGPCERTGERRGHVVVLPPASGCSRRWPPRWTAPDRYRASRLAAVVTAPRIESAERLQVGR
ncbi:hypothetical protein [Actinomadura miaoliensis]|uniref:hypothetical protein n=1 Tax=Actinomadura miaoliensis TaxID=430685 RepID=UPI0031E67944